jgi:hypothetical protein
VAHGDKELTMDEARSLASKSFFWVRIPCKSKILQLY